MKLYATTTSERASKGQGGNEYIIIDLNVGQNTVAQIELYYNADTVKDEQMNMDEWVLQYRRVGGIEKEWTILDQDNVEPEQLKGKSQKGKKKIAGSYPLEYGSDNARNL